eukprot:scaffold19924_cov117-Cylindrotheca_fusiformis.AAC.1
MAGVPVSFRKFMSVFNGGTTILLFVGKLTWIGFFESHALECISIKCKNLLNPPQVGPIGEVLSFPQDHLGSGLPRA